MVYPFFDSIIINLRVNLIFFHCLIFISLFYLRVDCLLLHIWCFNCRRFLYQYIV